MWQAPIYLVSNSVSAKTWSPGCFDPATSGCKDCKFLSKTVTNQRRMKGDSWTALGRQGINSNIKLLNIENQSWILCLARSWDCYLARLCLVRLRWVQCENLQHICIGICKPLNLSLACILVLHSLSGCTHSAENQCKLNFVLSRSGISSSFSLFCLGNMIFH